ncbi:MAG TPA: copper resistance protein CopC [Caulobacterales bacterium]|nr:copper resistance protein CopC [Caulobacterales bacterium]
MTESSPVHGSFLAQSPKEIRVAFAENMIAKNSTFSLEDSNQKTFRLGPAPGDPANPTAIIVPVLDPLPAGMYFVRWKVASAKHANVPGVLRFRVGS